MLVFILLLVNHACSYSGTVRSAAKLSSGHCLSPHSSISVGDYDLAMGRHEETVKKGGTYYLGPELKSKERNKSVPTLVVQESEF
jgi:hypothetical protein